MAQFVLSNRLQKFQDAVRSFGDTAAAMQRQKVEDARRADQDAMQKKVVEGQLAGQAQEQELRGLELGQKRDQTTALGELHQLEAGTLNPMPQGSFGEGNESPLVGADPHRDYKDRLIARANGVSVDQVRQERESRGLQAETAKIGQQTAMKNLEMVDKEFGLQDRRVKVSEGQLALDKRKLDEELKRLAAGGIDPDKVAAVEEKLRKEYIAQNKDFQAVSESFGRIKAAGAEPSAAGDLALIFNYMKMLDPGSVVRESEFATASNAAGVPDRIRNQYNRILDGKRLAPDQRKDFIGRSEKLYGSALDGYKRSQGTYIDLADKYGVNPARVTIDLSRVADEAPKAPAMGSSKRALAQQALNDPNATPEERAQAQRILQSGN